MYEELKTEKKKENPQNFWRQTKNIHLIYVYKNKNQHPKNLYEAAMK